jgi:DNA polymerase III gamma/tau subunit
MSSLKQLIINAIVKVSVENPALNREGEMSAEEARDLFIQMLVAELFPSEEPVVAQVEVPVAPKSPPKKAKSPKKAPEDKEAEKAAKEAEKAAAKAAKEAEKAAAKAAKEAEKAAAKAAKEAEKEAKKSAKKEEVKVKEEPPALPASPKEEKPKKPRAPKAKPATDANLPKIDPTWRKALKEADKDHAKEHEAPLLAYLNGLSHDDFHAKGAKEHVADFLATLAPPQEEESKVAVDLEAVEFKGMTYYVNPETKRVYEGVETEDGELTITKPVGYVGMADFKEMTL